MEKHVVIIYAHPDDESFGAAGTILKFRKQGVKVTYLCGTLGQMGRNMGSPIFANRETLPKIREKELAETCAYLDIECERLGLHDKMIEFENREEIAHKILEKLKRLKPTLVITHYPDYAIHPDHNAIGAATIEAVHMIKKEDRPTVWAQAISPNYEEVLGKPDIVHDVRDIFDKKIEAIFTHRSQAEGMLRGMDGTSRSMDEVKKDMIGRLGIEQFYVWDYHD